MQDYRRRIAYFYVYENGVQMHSAGFVKMEKRDGLCRLEIHLKKEDYPGGKVYIYFYHQNRIVGICLGDLQSRNDAMEWKGEISAGNIMDKGIRLTQTRGVWVRGRGNREYVAEWDDYPVDVSRFVLYPRGGQKCIRCPRFGNCERSGEDAADERRTLYERSHPAGT